MKKKELITLISDFNVEPFIRIFNSQDYSLKFNKFFYTSIHTQLINTKNSNNLLIWINPESIFKSVNNFFKGEKISYNLLDREVDNFIKILINNLDKNEKVFLVSFFSGYEIPFTNDYLMKSVQSKTYLFNYINNKLSKKLHKFDNLYIIDLNQIIINYKSEFYQHDYFLATKSSYSINFYDYFSKFFLKLNKNLFSMSKKIIILDLDDTLWGGVVGEIGFEKINLGGNNMIGEAFKDFQKKLLYLKNQGIQLGIVSKNEESVALRAIDSHPEMILRKKDFAICKINWKNKVENIINISEEINLDLNSFVFFDNSEFERRNVLETLPQILTPDLSDGPIYFSKILNSLKCFNIGKNTFEDKKRTIYYRQNIQRKKLYNKLENKNKWLKELNIKVKIKKISPINELRTLQLLNKTNQMNMQTNRYTSSKLKNFFYDKKNNHIFIAEIKDKFGDYGLTGIISYTEQKNLILIKDFVLSCRIMGRDVENKLVNFVFAKNKKNKILIFKYKKTKKNKPMLDFLSDKKYFKEIKKNEFAYKV